MRKHQSQLPAKHVKFRGEERVQEELLMLLSHYCTVITRMSPSYLINQQQVVSVDG